MKILANLKVGTKLTLLIVTLLACIASVSVASIVVLQRVDIESDKMEKEVLTALGAAKDAEIALLASSRAIRNLANSPEHEFTTYTTRYARYNQEALEQLEKVASTVSGPEAKKLCKDARTAYLMAQEEQKKMIQVITVEQPPHQSLFYSLTELRKLEDQAEAAMVALAEEMVREAAQSSSQTSAISSFGLYLSITCMGVALLLGGILGFFIKRAIANPLVEIAGKAARIAQGDLDQHFDADRRDEIGGLANSLEAMVENLRIRIADAEEQSKEATRQSHKAGEAMLEAQAAKEKAEQGQAAILQVAENIEVVVGFLTSATDALLTQVEQSAGGAEYQRERVISAATAMEEMNSTVMEVARNAGATAQGSERAKNKAEQGSGIVRQSVEAIGQVQNNTLRLKTSMETLGEQVEAIGAIMTVISDIADQTNLLALNAAIEAARAGDAGRGFAVVADEVRKLAEKTMIATKEVGQAVLGIQNGARSSITAVGETVNNLSTAINLANQSGEALVEIVNESVHTADQVRNIATAAEEQSAASDEITASLNEINRLTVENATVMQHSKEAVNALTKQAHDLEELVQKLREGEKK